jgi:hypothetical protein
MTSTLKKITTKAKQLYKTGNYAKWTDAIKEASKSLHKSASKTVKKHATKVKKYAVKKAKSGIKSLAKKVYESKHLSGVKTKKKATPKSLHKDTKSHNVRISVMSGVPKNWKGFKTHKGIVIDIEKTPSGKKLFSASVRPMSPAFYTGSLTTIKKFIDRELKLLKK